MLHRLRTSWLGRNIAFLLVIASCVSAFVTYSAISASHEPLSVKPRRVILYMLPNLLLLLALVGIIGARIFTLWGGCASAPVPAYRTAFSCCSAW